MRRATRRMRSASASDDPPNFWTTRGADMRGILAGSRARRSPRQETRNPTRPRRFGPGYRGEHRFAAPNRATSLACASTWTAGRQLRRSPAARSTPSASRSRPPTATQFAAFRARASRADRRGHDRPARRSRPAPLLRGAGAAVRRGRHRRDRDRLLRANRRARRVAATTSTTCRTSARRRTTPGGRHRAPRPSELRETAGFAACSRSGSAWAAGSRS